MAKTATQIRNQALRELGVLPLGQTASAEWAQSVDEAYTEVYAALQEHDLAVWSSSESVPDAYVNPVVVLVAAQRLNVAGVSNDRYQRIANAAAGALSEIRRIKAGQWFNTRDVEDY